MNFDFVTDSRFKDLILRDYKELKVCLDNKSSKAVLILSGSIIEASLVEYFLQKLPAGKTEEDLLKMTLGPLIDLAETEGLLTNTDKKLASVIQDYRNLIHPGRQIRKSEKYDFETATIANSLVTIILNAISSKQQASTFFTAQEIIDKLKNDWSFRTIYSKVILKLKHTERNKLFDLLLFYEMKDKEKWDAFMSEGIIPQYEVHNLYDIKPLVADLKPLLQPDIILGKINELVTEIQKGDRLKAFALFNFLHEDIDKLPNGEQEMIAIYFLSTFSSVLEKCNELSSEKTYSTIGKYITTADGINAFNEFTVFCIVHFEKKSISYEMDVYEQAFNSLQDNQKDEVRLAANDFMFKKGHPPTNVMEGFVDGAIQRGILSMPTLTTA